MITKQVLWRFAAVLGTAFLVGACGGRADRPPVVTSEPPPRVEEPEPVVVERPEPPAPPEPVEDPGEDLARMDDPYNITGRTLDEINADSPLEDIRFHFDSAVLTDDARRRLDEHAELMRQYPQMNVMIEGHCDERGTVEYNLALGERRAAAVYNYFMSLGITASRLKTISYGKEFPLDPGHNESAWAVNRRAHFEITAK